MSPELRQRVPSKAVLRVTGIRARTATVTVSKPCALHRYSYVKGKGAGAPSVGGPEGLMGC